jgi:hypothetical protein
VLSSEYRPPTRKIWSRAFNPTGTVVSLRPAAERGAITFNSSRIGRSSGYGRHSKPSRT